MTVSVQSGRAEYVGNGVTTNFAVSFEFDTSADLKVYQAGVLKTVTTHYTVSGGSGSTGTVSFLVAPAAAEEIVIIDDPAVTQQTDYVENDPFPAESHERALDKLTRIARRQKEQLERVLILADSDTSTVSTVLPSPEALKVIGWGSEGDSLVNIDVSTLATLVIGANKVLDVFSGDGVQVDFILSADPLSLNNTEVFIGGVYQQKSEYSLAGHVLTFTAAPPSGTNNIEVIQSQAQTYPVSAIVDGAVTTSKIADDSVTLSKMQEIDTEKLLGRSTAGVGNPEALGVSAPLAISGGNLTTSMATGSLLGRSTAGTGVAEVIAVGSGLTLSGGTLSADGEAAASESTAGIVELASSGEFTTGTDTSRVPAVKTIRDNSIVNETMVATTSGTQVLFGGIPAWVKRINIMFAGVSLSGGDQITLLLGDAGGLETSGYSSGALYVSDDTAANMGTSSIAFRLTAGNAAGATTSGMVVLQLMDAATNLWVLSGNLCNTAAPRMFVCAGSKALSAALTQIAIDTDGTNTFDAGSINISYE